MAAGQNGSPHRSPPDHLFYIPLEMDYVLQKEFGGVRGKEGDQILGILVPGPDNAEGTSPPRKGLTVEEGLMVITISLEALHTFQGPPGEEGRGPGGQEG